MFIHKHISAGKTQVVLFNLLLVTFYLCIYSAMTTSKCDDAQGFVTTPDIHQMALFPNSCVRRLKARASWYSAHIMLTRTSHFSTDRLTGPEIKKPGDKLKRSSVLSRSSFMHEEGADSWFAPVRRQIAITSLNASIQEKVPADAVLVLYI